MARRLRNEITGCFYHIHLRGVARRQVFMTPRDYAFFLALLALAVRRGEIEVHAYCLMQNHFHVLVRSLGGMSKSMKRTLESYVMRFNRIYERDGALFAGRYRSKLVGTNLYRAMLVRYIDHNAVEAGIVERPEDYAYSSAADILNGVKRPWLETSWIVDEVRARMGPAMPFGQAYRSVFGRLPPASRELVGARLEHPKHTDELERIVHADSKGLREWFRERALHADGKLAALPVATAQSVTAAWEAAGFDEALAHLPSGADIAWTGLLRELSSLSFPEIARLTGVSRRGAQRRYDRHRCFVLDPVYADALAACARSCADATLLGSDPRPAPAGV